MGPTPDCIERCFRFLKANQQRLLVEAQEAHHRGDEEKAETLLGRSYEIGFEIDRLLGKTKRQQRSGY